MSACGALDLILGARVIEPRYGTIAVATPA